MLEKERFNKQNYFLFKSKIYFTRRWIKLDILVN